ncbi:MAG: hypothetical protein VBE63_25965 [Lamprobacter sp.]|uniref:hypothetical protein n=1 Tax=Lamprobacter sp. TaxID=3100796 RepID=UPI002B25D8B6|nr:hypothetical protein [Lamprobacter sp.]MEA3643354.1 hypothetical protein [Lamprobacter sp.]
MSHIHLTEQAAQIQELLAIWRIDQEIAQRIDPIITSSTLINAEINRIAALPIGPELQDRQNEAQQIKDSTLALLHRKYSQAKAYESERAWDAKRKRKAL